MEPDSHDPHGLFYKVADGIGRVVVAALVVRVALAAFGLVLALFFFPRAN